MKSFAVEFKVPNVFVKVNEVPMIVPSMVLSTISVLTLATLFPALMPLWMAWSTGSNV